MQHVFTGPHHLQIQPMITQGTVQTTPTQSVATSTAVVERVAAREGVDHTELVPLFDAIDPDALDTLVESSRRNDAAMQLTFSYNGYDVTVTGQGEIHLTRLTHSEE